MPALTDPVIALALDQVLAWQADALPPLPVAVNLSASCVTDTALSARVAAALANRGLPGTMLLLEITEQCLIKDRIYASQVLAELREQGVRGSIDDFGTGYSSLAYLRDLPVDELTLDRAFIAPSPTTPAPPPWSRAPSPCRTRWVFPWSPKESRTRSPATCSPVSAATSPRATTSPAHARRPARPLARGPPLPSASSATTSTSTPTTSRVGVDG